MIGAVLADMCSAVVGPACVSLVTMGPALLLAAQGPGASRACVATLRDLQRSPACDRAFLARGHPSRACCQRADTGRRRGRRSKLRVRDTQFSSKAYGTHDWKEVSIDGRMQLDLMMAIQRDHKLSRRGSRARATTAQACWRGPLWLRPRGGKALQGVRCR